MVYFWVGGVILTETGYFGREAPGVDLGVSDRQLYWGARNGAAVPLRHRAKREGTESITKGAVA